MNILFYRYGSICEPDIIEGFEELGFTINEITDEISDKSITGQQQIMLLSEQLQRGNYQFVFTINFFPAISEVCNIYKIPYLCLIVDSPVMELYSDSITNAYNRIFLFDKALYNEFVEYNPNCIFHLPLATNVSRWDKVISNASTEALNQFTSKISFIGSLYSEKCPYYQLQFPNSYIEGYLQGLLCAQEKVYGYFFLEDALEETIVDTLVSSTPDFYQFPEKSRRNDKAALAQFYLGPKITEMERIKMLSALGNRFPVNLYSGSNNINLPVQMCGRVKTHTQMPLVFHQSQINLNMTAKSIRSGIPQRVWDVLGCQGFLISNYQTEIPEHFTIGEDLLLYTSKEELISLCDYYLNHPKKCQEIAYNAYKKIKDHHTWAIRLSQMLELAFFSK